MGIVESKGAWGIVETDDPHRILTPKPGDVIDFGVNKGVYPFTHGRYGRIWQIREDKVSFCCEMGSAFLSESGDVDISGGPFSGCYIRDLIPTNVLKEATMWNWGNNLPGAHKGVYYRISRPVFVLKPDYERLCK